MNKVVIEKLTVDAEKAKLDPGWTDLAALVREVEQGCRKNRLPLDELKELYEQSRAAEFSIGWVRSVKETREEYGYPYPSTQAVACRFGARTAFLVRRIHTPPGEEIPPPCYPVLPGDPAFEPLKWRDSVVSLFWQYVPKDLLEEIEASAVAQAREKAAEAEQRMKEIERLRSQEKIIIRVKQCKDPQV